MFNKLLSNLPFNPSLIHQFSFYGQRLKQESSVRRIGFTFMTLAFIVQLFAVLSPPQATLLASPNNDLIVGGIASRQDAVNVCTTPTASAPNYGAILSNYGISCQNVAAASTVTIASTDFGKQLFSMGRQPYGLAGETPVNIGGATYFWRYLWSWDKFTTSTYTALRVVNNSGTPFYILYNCGNLVSIGLPKAPQLQITKTTEPGYPQANTAVKPGQMIGFRIYFNNNGGTANNVAISDMIPANTSNPSLNPAGAASVTLHNGVATWSWPTLPAGAQNYYANFLVQVNANVATDARICNTATISSSNTPPLTSNQVCLTIVQPPPPPTPKTPPPVKPPVVPPVTPPTPSCPYDTTIPVTSPACKPCTPAQSVVDATLCLTFHKTASNLTQHISDANSTTAQASDSIQYTLIVKNTGKIDVKDYVIQENVNDIMDYADVINENGASLSTLGVLSWPAMTIPAGQTVQKSFTTKVKNPIPQTPQSLSDPGHFDHIMTDVFGNTINISVPMPIVLAAAQTAQTSLPNTGPGSSLVIAFMVTLGVGYFFARSRLLAKEAVLIRHDVAANNGGI